MCSRSLTDLCAGIALALVTGQALAAPPASAGEVAGGGVAVPAPGQRQVLRLSDVLGSDAPATAPRDSSAWGLALGQHIARGTTGHPSILEARSSVTGALAGADAARWQRAPTATFSREYAGKYASQTYSNLLRVQQPLWTGGQITAGIDLAQHQATRARHALREAQRNLALKITANWSDWARASLRVERLGKLVEQQAALLEMISRRYAQGSATVSDEALARARLEGALGEQAQARIDLAWSRTQLERNTAGTVDDALLRDLDGALPDVPTLAEVIDAIESAPALNRAAVEIEIARAELAQRRAGLHPQVYLRLDRQWGAIKDERVTIALQGSTGAGLGGLAALDVQEARIQSARLAVETLRNELRDQYTQEHIRHASADQRARLTQAYAQTSSTVLASYRRQFDAGRRSWMELLNMVREVHQADLDAAVALVDQRVAAYRVLLLVRAPDLNNDFSFGQELPR
ncbi:TolC family protein [Sphaerotilus mobilis]|uniref:Adhesin transport system outer membrane protein n=1 Tax=Sphaerotilus mobilis TaxID=47994 RepID=A0A4Q7LDJ7_9BURK|nr:TolC family protein [Sphaerotilus mobilis]RZS52134.1 adhesin transport system outer membrane protein [Sphaerotilus mobilis]